MARQPASPAPYVFLSYASRDRDRALALADALQGCGVRVWVDRRSIAGGTSWDTEIVHGIKGCGALLVLCTDAAMASVNVHQEIRLALEERHPILPLLLEPVVFADEVRYALAGRQWVEVLDRPQDEWLPALRQTLAALGVGVDHDRESGVSAPAAPSSPAARPPRRAAPMCLPAALTSFVGREREVEQVRRLLAEARLVTLTGPGGTGKTRLALEVARVAADDFADGGSFVALASISEPGLVTSALAQTLGVREAEGQPLFDSLAAYLRDKQFLVVLDNFEHVLAAAPVVTALLAACPGLTALITSRFVLHISGEREFPVSPLALPDPAQLPPVGQLREYPAIALFEARARDARPDFAVTAENAAAVAAICRRLDGLPLAIELAAARAKLLPPPALLARLDQRLRLLTGGARDLPARQQTLRDAIAWSYDLLTPAEQTLFRRLAVFAGGCTLDAAEQICSRAPGPSPPPSHAGDEDGGEADLDLDMLDGISSLVDKSLLRQSEGPDGEPRFGMLETIREFAGERLAESGESDGLRRRHADYFVALAEAAEPHVHGASETRLPWLLRATAEQDNLRAALRWSVEHNHPEVGLRIIGPLWLWYWFRALTEGRRWVEALLALVPADERRRIPPWGLFAAGALAYAQGDMPTLRARWEEGATIAREVGEKRLEALLLAGAAIGMADDPPRGRAMMDEAWAISGEVGEPWSRAMVAMMGGMGAVQVGDGEAAHRWLDEAEAAFRALADREFLGVTLMYAGLTALQQGELETAQRQLSESLASFRAIGDNAGASMILAALAGIAWQHRDYGRAAGHLAEGLMLARYTGDLLGVIASLRGLAALATIANQRERADALLRTAQALDRANGSPPPPAWYRPVMDAVRATLGDDALAGREHPADPLSLDEAVAEALAVAGSIDRTAGAGEPEDTRSTVA